MTTSFSERIQLPLCAVNPPAIPARPSRIPPHLFRRSPSRTRLEPVPWQMALRRRGRQGWAELLAPKTTSKIGCFAAPHAGKSPAWRLNSALPGVKQRRQDVREFPTCRVSETAQFFHRFLEKQSNRALPAVKIRGARTTSWPDAKEPRRPGREIQTSPALGTNNLFEGLHPIQLVRWPQSGKKYNRYTKYNEQRKPCACFRVVYKIISDTALRVK